jgi:DNA-directed RNA polymerase specialized sigma24 family protein
MINVARWARVVAFRYRWMRAPWERAQSDARLDGAALWRMLAGALASLTTGQEAAVRLRVVDQLEYPEVGRVLGCSSVAARIPVSRGLRVLLERLEGGTDD